MKIKVCGMRDSQNLEELIALQPDYIGLIFYAKSPRYVVDLVNKEFINQISKDIQKVGVFVNESTEQITTYVKEYNLNALQLHGKETPAQCEELQGLGLPIIKAFSVGEDFDFSQLEVYKASCDYFLFDTKGKGYGGNGVTFDWTLLQNYDNEKPFFLSGGLDAQNISQVKELSSLNVYAVDVNSKFEIKPALKDIKLLQDSVFKEFR